MTRFDLMDASLPRWQTVLAKSLTLTGTACTLLLPLLMFYSRALSDIAATLIGVFFLIYSGLTRDWQWLRKPWIIPAALFCGLCLISSVHVGLKGAWTQALCLPRLFLLTAATQNWILARQTRRMALGGVFFLLALWLMSQCWEQYLTGTNLMGAPRWGDGSLTGPFVKPRAGFTFLMLFFPGIMPVVLHALHSKNRGAWAGGCVLLLFSALTMVLIGQRMSNVLLLFGLFLTALLVRQFRWPFVALLACVAAALASLPVISPPTYAKLVLKFSNQLQHFATSDYGLLFTKASIMVLNHPWLGLGVDGFRNFCQLGMHSAGISALGLPPLDSPAGTGCNIHPHNYYLQVATTAGLLGLAAFAATVVCWLRAGARHLSPTRAPHQAMLFVMCCTVLWPIASTSALFSFPTAGWVFLFAGWLMAAAQNADPLHKNVTVPNDPHARTK